VIWEKDKKKTVREKQYYIMYLYSNEMNNDGVVIRLFIRTRLKNSDRGCAQLTICRYHGHSTRFSSMFGFSETITITLENQKS